MDTKTMFFSNFTLRQQPRPQGLKTFE